MKMKRARSIVNAPFSLFGLLPDFKPGHEGGDVSGIKQGFLSEFDGREISSLYEFVKGRSPDRQ